MKEAAEQLGRLITASVTALGDNGEYSSERNRSLAQYLVEEQQSDAVVSIGTTGESPTVTVDERRQHLNDVMRGVDRRAKVIAGTGTNNTQESVELSQLAKADGADALLLVVPPYNRPSQLGLIRHFGKIAEAVDIPIILYNVPSRTGTNMTAETVLTLDREFDHIVGVKEAIGLKTEDGRNQIRQILEEASEGFREWSGNDDDTLPMMRMGAFGVVSVVSHLKGRQLKRMIEHHLGGEDEEAQQIHDNLAELIRYLFPNEYCKEPNPSGVKAMLNLSGIPVGTTRWPVLDILREPDYEAYRDHLRSVLARYNLVPIGESTTTSET